MSKQYKIVIIGLGFVGLSFAVFLAQKNCKIVGVEQDNKKINMIRKGIAPFFEPGFNKMLRTALKKSLIITNSINNINDVDFVFITVGTPSKKDGSINLKYIKKVTKDISKWIESFENFPIIAYKSTIIPSTAENFIKPILSKSNKKLGKDFDMVVNPEFLREGSALVDTINPHLIVIGGSKKATSKLKKFYLSIYSKNIPIKETNLTTAELIKYANNSFLATKISFINSIANLCQKLPGTNVDEIADSIGMDPRINPHFLKAGLGYGGSCFPKDVKALLSLSKTLKVNSILDATNRVNQNQMKVILNLMKKNLKQFKNSNVSILGLSFKENSDDIRESVSIKLIHKLLSYQVNIRAHDPRAIENTKNFFGNRIKYFTNTRECLKNSSCAILITPWKEYQNLTENDFKIMRKPFVIDTRRILTKKRLKLNYVALGVGS